MFKFIDKIVDKVQDRMLDYVDKYLDDDMKPALHDVVEEQVREFRATVVEEVPEKVGKKLRDKDDSTITGMIAEALSDKVEMMLEHMLEYYRPEVDKTTETLTDTITNESMVKVKEFLKLNEQHEAQHEAKPEARSRDFKMPGIGKIDITESIGTYFKVEQRLPQLEKSLRTNFQPIGEVLKKTLWEKFIHVLNLVLNESFPWLNLPVPKDLVVATHRSRGWIGNRIDDIEEVFKDKIRKRVPEFYDALQDPVEEIIARMVQWLEDHSVQAAIDLLTSLVKKLDLVKQ